MDHREKIAELEALIELAEKVSINISSNTIKSNKATFTIIIAIVLFPLGLIFFQLLFSRQSLDFQIKYEILTGSLGLFSLLIFSFFFATMFFSQRRLLAEIENEDLILKRLLDMVHSYKELVYPDISIVKKAILDMRLSRINFNTRKNKLIFKLGNKFIHIK